MKIARIETHGFRSIADRAWSLSNAEGTPYGLVVVTGPSGSGKTTFLDLIRLHKEAVAPYGAPIDAAELIRRGESAAHSTVHWWLDPHERASGGAAALSPSHAMWRRDGIPEVDADPGLRSVLERYAHDRTGKVDYYADDRSLPRSGALMPDLEEDQRMQRLAKGPGKYAALVGYVRDVLKEDGPSERANALRELFAELCPGRMLAGSSGRGIPMVHGADGSETPVDRLSGSEQQAFLFAATTVMLRLQGSIVLIDTMELRLAPGEASRFLRVLMSAAPDNQWVVTTCDPGVIAMAPQQARVQLG